MYHFIYHDNTALNLILLFLSFSIALFISLNLKCSVIGDILCWAQKSNIFLILFGLPTGDPEIDFRPLISEKTEVSMGASTAPTK
jgi:hypothetical protein